MASWKITVFVKEIHLQIAWNFPSSCQLFCCTNAHGQNRAVSREVSQNNDTPNSTTMSWIHSNNPILCHFLQHLPLRKKVGPVLLAYDDGWIFFEGTILVAPRLSFE